MTKTAIIYARVSSERQAGDDRVSIEQQLDTCHKLCATIGFEVAGVYIDKDRYIKTRTPNKGKMTEPSGKFDDRPGLLQMLERVETGDIDAVISFDASRIGRHYRVLGTLSNSLDIARQTRNGRGEVQVWEAAKHNVLSGVMLGIMISIAQEENETRARRVVMGIEGTLQQGRWPAMYRRLGYSSHKEPGKRGHIIELGPPEEVQLIQDMFDWADKGEGCNKITRKVNAMGIMLDRANVGKLLTAPAYKGELAYTLKNGQTFTLNIPQIITPEQWDRVQAQRKTNTLFCQRNTKNIFLAQHLGYCGQCGWAMHSQSGLYAYKTLADGTRKRYNMKSPSLNYCCNRRVLHVHENRSYPARTVDNLIWRTLADAINTNPDEIINQTVAKVKELQAEGDSVTGRIAQYQKQLNDLDAQELAYNRQMARGKLSEQNYDVLISEVETSRADAQKELTDLISLRDETEKTKNTLDFARKLLGDFGQRIAEIDYTEAELAKLPPTKKMDVLTRRQQLVRALVERIGFYPDKLVITGAIGDRTVSLIEGMRPGASTINLQYHLTAKLPQVASL